MAATEDVVHPRVYLNPLPVGPSESASQNPGTDVATQPLAQGQSLTTCTQTTESPLAELRVVVTVLRAHNVPNHLSGLNFFVTVVAATEESTVKWNEILSAFAVQPSSRLVLRLYAERLARPDILIGTHEMVPVAQSNTPFILTMDEGRTRQSNQPTLPVTLYLNVVVSLNTPPYDPILPFNAANRNRNAGPVRGPKTWPTNPYIHDPWTTDSTEYYTAPTGSETLEYASCGSRRYMAPSLRFREYPGR
ncbi:hypothetical protein EI94DRAFT_1742400 [Lactarius quietus]|nr:hypothetical protein EI94DRAFT_1742400 [Lactarius quietus]